MPLYDPAGARSNGDLKFDLPLSSIVAARIAQFQSATVDTFPEECRSLMRDETFFAAAESFTRPLAAAVQAKAIEWWRAKSAEALASAADGFSDVKAVFCLLVVIASPHNRTKQGLITISCSEKILRCPDPHVVYLGLLLTLHERMQSRRVNPQNASEALIKVVAGWGAEPSLTEILSGVSSSAQLPPNTDPPVLRDAVVTERPVATSVAPNGSGADTPSGDDTATTTATKLLADEVAANMRAANGSLLSMLWWARCRIVAYLLLSSGQVAELMTTKSGTFFRDMSKVEKDLTALMETDNSNVLGALADLTLLWATSTTDPRSAPFAAMRHTSNSPWFMITRRICSAHVFRKSNHRSLNDYWQLGAFVDALSFVVKTSGRLRESLVEQQVHLLRRVPDVCPLLIIHNMMVCDRTPQRYLRDDAAPSAVAASALNAGFVDALVALLASELRQRSVVCTPQRREVIFAALEALRDIVLNSVHHSANPVTFMLTAKAEGFELSTALHDVIQDARSSPYLAAAAIQLYAASIHHNVRDVVPALLERGVLRTVLAAAGQQLDSDEPCVRLAIPSLLQAFAVHNQTHGDLLASRDSVRQLTLTILRCPNLKPPVAGGASDSTAAVTKVCVELLTPFGRELFHLAKAVPGLLDSILEAVGEAAGMAGTTQTSPETSKVILLNIMALLCSAKPPAAASPIQRPQIAAPVAEEMHELHQRGLVTPIIFLFDRLASSFVALDSPRLVGAFLKALEPDDFTAITRILLKSAERVSSKSNSVEGLSANEVTYMEYVLSLTIALEPMRRQEHVAGVRDRLMQHLFEIFFNVRRFGSVVAAIPEDTAAPARPGTFFGLELSETHPLRRFVANMSEFCSTDPRVATPHRGGMTHHFHDADDFLFARERLYHGTPATDPTSLTHILEQTQRMLSHGPSSMPYEILCEIHMRLHVCEAMLKTQGVTVSMTTSAHHHCRALNTIADSIRLRYSSTPFIDAEERRVVVNIVGLVCSIAKLLAGSPRGMPRDVERRRPLVQLVTFVFESWLQMAPPTKKVMLSTIELMANMGRDLFLNGSGGGGVSGSSSRPPPWQGDSWDDPGIMDQFDRPLHVDQFARRSAEMRSLAEMRSPLETFDSERRPARVMARDIRRARDASVAADSPRGGPMSPPDPSSPVNAAARLANNALQWMAVALCHQSQMDYTEEEKRQLNIHSSRIVFACWGAMARNGKREVVRFVVEKFLEDAGKYYPLLDPLAVALSQQRTQHVRSAIARRTTLPDLLVDESCRCLDRLKEFHNAAAAGCDGDAAETRQIPADLRQSTEGTIAAAVRFLSCLSVHKDPRAQGGPTRPCEHFQNGFCWNGNACGMAHIENPSARTSSDGADKEVADEISAVLVASGFPEPPAADPSDSSFHSASAAAVPVIFAGGSSFLRSSAIARIVEFSFDLLKHWPLIGPQAHPGGPTMPDSLNLLHQVIHADHPVASRQLQALYAKDGDGMILANVLPAAATLDLAAKEALAKIFRLCLDDVDATAWQVFTAMKKAIVVVTKAPAG